MNLQQYFASPCLDVPLDVYLVLLQWRPSSLSSHEVFVHFGTELTFSS